MCTRACTWWAYGDWIKLFGPCWPTDWICKSVFFVWWQCDASMTRGARNVLPVMCGRGVKACFWLREFRLAAWPRFLFFPAQGIHGNICLCACARVCVCAWASICTVCAWNCASALALSFPLQRRHCAVLGRGTPNVTNCPSACPCICGSMCLNVAYVHLMRHFETVYCLKYKNFKQDFILLQEDAVTTAQERPTF